MVLPLAFVLFKQVIVARITGRFALVQQVVLLKTVGIKAGKKPSFYYIDEQDIKKVV